MPPRLQQPLLPQLRLNPNARDDWRNSMTSVDDEGEDDVAEDDDEDEDEEEDKAWMMGKG